MTLKAAIGAVVTEHKRCPFCEGQGTTTVWSGDALATCDDCQGTGLAITWAAQADLIGGHYHVSLWAGRKGMRANLGKVIMAPDDWTEFQQQGKRMTPPLEVRHVCPECHGYRLDGRLVCPDCGPQREALR